MTLAESLAPGTLLAEKFRIERQLGAGAMGAVYEIHHELTRHRRAIKLLHPSARMVPELVRRFLNEASAAGRAGNPHLVETFDAGTLPTGEPYVVMELLEGEALSELLKREGPLDVRTAAELVAQAAEGLAAAHAVGIVHRDVKPDNLYVTHREGKPFIKILDFGVSKFATVGGSSLDQTRAGVLYGTPSYMPPEQLAGALDIDERTDVYALGVVLYQCLTGRLPFEAASLPSLNARVSSGQFQSVESLRSDVPKGLSATVHRTLAPSRAARFENARRLIDALEPYRAAFASSETELGAPADLGTSYPTGVSGAHESIPLARKRRSILLLAGVGVALLALPAMVWMQRRSSGVSSKAQVQLGTSPSATEQEAQWAPSPSSSIALAAPTAAAPRPEPLPTQAKGKATRIAPPPLSSQSAPGTARVEAGLLPARVAPQASATARQGAAEQLGIHQNNPFR